MASPSGARLVQTCESLCEELRRGVGLTLFRIELERRTGPPLVVTLRTQDRIVDPRHEWMRPAAPAILERPLVHDARRIGSLRIEDERRSDYPAETGASLERILRTYTAAFDELLERAQL